MGGLSSVRLYTGREEEEKLGLVTLLSIGQVPPLDKLSPVYIGQCEIAHRQ